MRGLEVVLGRGLARYCKRYLLHLPDPKPSWLRSTSQNPTKGGPLPQNWLTTLHKGHMLFPNACIFSNTKLKVRANPRSPVRALGNP